MAARHWQWCGANTLLLVASLSKHAIGNGVFVNAPLLVASLVVDWR
jgi:hypothetical protein